MERQVEILLEGCQEEFSQEILKRCRQFLSTHTIDGDDPLEVWYQYIKWAEQHFPVSGRSENIQKLLHTCLNQFNNSEEYFQDVRFIKLWLKYAEMAENPLQIYNQLSTCGIGVQCSLFYKSWADELFRNGDFKKADKVFREGISRKAHPLNKLQSAYGNFHIAVARRMLDETRVHKSSGIENWTDCNLILGGGKLGSFSELSSIETQLTTASVLKPVENLPCRFAAKCSKEIEKGVCVKSIEKNGTKIERDTKQASTVQRRGKYPPNHGTRLGNSQSDHKSKAKDGFHCPVAVFEVPNPFQRPMYPKEKVYADNTEYSLEELRAGSYIRKKPNTERGNHPHPVTVICNQMHSCETTRSPLTSVVDKKLADYPNSVSKNLEPFHVNENFSMPTATCGGIRPTTNLRHRNIENLHSNVAHQHSLASASTKLAMNNILPTEIVSDVPWISFKETSAVPGLGNTYSNQHHKKEHPFLAVQIESASQSPAINSKYPVSNPLHCDAEPNLSGTKETVSHESARNITLRGRTDSKVHPLHRIGNGSGAAVQKSILPHKAELVPEPGHNATEPEDLKEHHIKYEIPFVPSPGMTTDEVEHLKGTENKENEYEVSKNLNKCERHLPAEPKEKDVFKLDPRQSAFFSDSCTSQMFAHTLLSSTPARKSVFHLANNNQTISIANPPVYARTSDENTPKNMVGESQHEAGQLHFSAHTVSCENKELLKPENDHPLINKSKAISEAHNICPIAKQQHSTESTELHQGHSYRGVEDEINPFDEVLISNLLLHSGFLERNEGTWLKVLQKPMPRIRLPFTLKIDDEIYQIIKEIGKGSYARILYATVGDGERVALKVQRPSWLWEAYIEDQIQQRIKDKSLGLCFANPSRVYKYTDGSIMVHEFLKYGSILKFITEARKINRAVNENVIFCFMCKLIEAVRCVHNCKIIHGDLKPDNIMIRTVNPPSIQLIDFGRAIDMTLFPPKTTFTYAVTTKDFQCTEMQLNKPWTYQTDIYGLLSTAHCFLFGEYMKVSHKSGKWVIQKSLPRSCNKQLWSQFFHDLLNIESCEKLPDLSYWEATMQKEIDVSVLNDQLKVIKNAMDGY